MRLAECKVLLLGTGGAGSAVAFALADLGVASMTLVDIDHARASNVAERLKTAYPRCSASIGSPDAAGHDLIINATPVGMNPNDALPADFGPLAPKTIVVDIVPKPETPFMKKARADGCRTLDFRTMADGQRTEMMRFFGM